MDCEVCMEDFDEERWRPKILPCGHTYCLDCLQRMPKRSCPVDGKPYSGQATELADNYQLLKLASARSEARRARQQRRALWCRNCAAQGSRLCYDEGHTLTRAAPGTTATPKHVTALTEQMKKSLRVDDVGRGGSSTSGSHSGPARARAAGGRLALGLAAGGDSKVKVDAKPTATPTAAGRRGPPGSRKPEAGRLGGLRNGPHHFELELDLEDDPYYIEPEVDLDDDPYYLEPEVDLYEDACYVEPESELFDDPCDVEPEVDLHDDPCDAEPEVDLEDDPYYIEPEVGLHDDPCDLGPELDLDDDPYYIEPEVDLFDDLCDVGLEVDLYDDLCDV